MGRGQAREWKVSWLAHSLFTECERKWFNRYLGQDLRDRDLAFELKAQAKVSFWQAYCGHVVDDALKHAVRTHRDTRQWPEDLHGWARERFRLYARYSRALAEASRDRKTWPKDGAQAIDRHFFAVFGDPSPTAQEHEALFDHATRCLDAFWAGPLPGLVASLPPEAVLCPEGAPSFTFEGRTVWAAYDLVLRPQDRTVVFDFKTGKFGPKEQDKALEQLHWYAAYAQAEWGEPWERVKLAPVFLAASGDWHEHPVEPDRVERAQERWRWMEREVESRLGAGDADAVMARFALASDLNTCARCPFRSCEGYSRLASAP